MKREDLQLRDEVNALKKSVKAIEDRLGKDERKLAAVNRARKPADEKPTPTPEPVAEDRPWGDPATPRVANTGFPVN